MGSGGISKFVVKMSDKCVVRDIRVKCSHATDSSKVNINPSEMSDEKVEKPVLVPI